MDEYPNYRFMEGSTITLPKGWVRLGSAMMDEFQNVEEQGLLPADFRVIAIKEDFGRLLVSCLYSPKIADNLIKGFCIQASTTCEDCGYYPAKLARRRTWVRTLCSSCRDRQGYSST